MLRSYLSMKSLRRRRSGSLVRWLFDNQLVDEITPAANQIKIHPFVQRQARPDRSRHSSGNAL